MRVSERSDEIPAVAIVKGDDHEPQGQDAVAESGAQVLIVGRGWQMFADRYVS